MSYLRRILYFGLVVGAICACSYSIKETNKHVSYFANLRYNKVDTVSLDPIDFSFVYYFLNDRQHEKVYVEKNTIKHVFGNLGEEGTFWANEWITYTTEGKIIDNESQYIFVNANIDSTEFILIGDDRLNFTIRIYESKIDSLPKVIKEIEPQARKIKVASSEFIGNSVSLLYRREFKEDNAGNASEIEVFINRETKASSQRHFDLIIDKRIETIVNMPL